MSQEILLLGSEVSVPSVSPPPGQGSQGQQKGTREKSLCPPPPSQWDWDAAQRVTVYRAHLCKGTHVNSSRIIQGLGGRAHFGTQRKNLKAG